MSANETSKRALTCLQKGDLQTAANLCQQAIKQSPSDPYPFYLLSEILLRASRAGEALHMIEKALTFAPDSLDYQAQHALCLLNTGQQKAALSIAEKLTDSVKEAPFACDILSRFYTTLGELTKACELAEACALKAPDNEGFQYNYATALRAVGRMAEAEAIYDRIIAKMPTDWEAYKNRSDLRKQTESQNHVDELKRALSRANDWKGRVQLCSALAKELEDINQLEESFQYLKTGNDLRREHMQYAVEHDIQVANLLMETFHEAPQSSAGFDTEEPVFILGMPRTGSTLVERMLSMRAELFAAGELSNFATAMVTAVKSHHPGKQLNRDDMVRASLQLDMYKLGESYIDSTRPRTGHTRYFIDKMPNNFLYIGLIKRALPKAKIIHLTRDPMDTCYAIYKTLFKQAYPFSYNLEDLAQYYVAYHRLMAHWRKVFPNTICDIAYERLVSEPETEAQRLADYLELDGIGQMLDFHKSSQPTNTASAAQVRSPIYTSSVAKWRHLEKELEPVMSILTAEGILKSSPDTVTMSMHDKAC